MMIGTTGINVSTTSIHEASSAVRRQSNITTVKIHSSSGSMVVRRSYVSSRATKRRACNDRFRRANPGLEQQFARDREGRDEGDEVPRDVPAEDQRRDGDRNECPLVVHEPALPHRARRTAKDCLDLRALRAEKVARRAPAK